ncbi:hypothetical protein [Salinifilum ghardaiensis]
MRHSGSAPFASILLLLGLIGFAVLGAVVAPTVLAPSRNFAEWQRVEARVVRTAPCAQQASRGDVVAYDLAGRTRTARFDGCGHAEGTALSVLVPPDAERAARAGGGPSGQVTAVPAGAAGSAEEDLARRLTWVLLSLAAAAGSGFAVLLGYARR